jgi:AraC-like DNA-binding protein
MDKAALFLYNYTIMDQFELQDSDQSLSLLLLLQRSLAWEYFTGSHSNPCCHAETDWRLMPFLVIVYPQQGEYYCKIENEGLLKINAGEVLLVPGGIRHTVSMPRPGIVSFAHIRYTVFGSMDIFHFFQVPRRVKKSAGIEIGRLTHDLHQAMAAKPLGADAFVQAIVRQELAARLLRCIISVSKLRRMDPGDLLEITRLEPVFNYVEEHIDRPIQRSELARLVFLSETRFHYVFKKVVGLAPMAYVMSVRMRKAQLLLAQPILTITQVGGKVGFYDIFHFSKTFKSTFGISPLHYRKKITSFGPRPWNQSQASR